jgi:hypothetical protein
MTFRRLCATLAGAHEQDVGARSRGGRPDSWPNPKEHPMHFAQPRPDRMLKLAAPDIDVARLRKELEYVTAHRDEHEQRFWAVRRPGCGTSHCLAGTVVMHEGLALDWKPITDPGSEWHGADSARRVADGRDIRDAARDLLGITTFEADALFFAENDLHTLWCVAEHITRGEITLPPEVPAKHNTLCATCRVVAGRRPQISGSTAS